MPRATQGNGGASQQQRPRTFRGRGGRAHPTDGRLPPKKNPRVRVRYRGGGDVVVAIDESTGDDGGPRRQDDGDDDELDGSHRKIDEIPPPMNGAAGDGEPREEEKEEDELHREIAHLRKRVRNVEESLRTSRGLADPEKWRGNCLIPVGNAAREWRSIVKFHRLDRGSERMEADDDDAGGEGVDEDRDELPRAAAREVFGLVQMAVQTGPLVGSNAGYFKRCGGPVASMAREFLGGIQELAAEEEVDDERGVMDERGDADGTGGDLNEDVVGLGASFDVGSADGGYAVCDECGADGNGEEGRTLEVAREVDSMKYERDGNDSGSDGEVAPKVGNSSESDGSGTESSDASSALPREDPGDATAGGQDATLEMVTSPPSDELARKMECLQKSLLFTEKQSRRFLQWMRDATKAVEKGMAPSKSAKKLQGQRSKKQRMKELKAQRKLKKEKRGGRR